MSRRFSPLGLLYLVGVTLGTLLNPIFLNAVNAENVEAVAIPIEQICNAGAIQSVVSGQVPAVSVREIPNGPKLANGIQFVAATTALTAYCQITGNFVTNERTGKTANFLATLPTHWNGKFLQIGCAGNCGSISFANDASNVANTLATQGYPGESILKGYASVSTDEGHNDNSQGRWAIKGPGEIDADALEDFYYRADKVLAQVGKKLVVSFYTRALGYTQKVARSYFSGCSGGGRDAYVAASYFPEEYDGIIGGSPYASPMAVAYQASGIALAQIRKADSDLSASLISQVGEIVKAKCDKADGIQDGIIQNPMACDFDPHKDLPRCDGKTARTRCFTSGQIDTLSAYFSAVTDESGNVVQPGFAVGDILAAANFRMPPPLDRNAADPWPNAEGSFWAMANGNLRILGYHNEASFEPRGLFSFSEGGPGSISSFHIVVPSASSSKVIYESRMGIGIIPENAAKLIKLNRKFIAWQSMSDQLLSPYMAINYYKQLASLYGGYEKLQNNIRLFAIPGSAHCSMAGEGPGNFDALTAMEKWVEKGEPPDGLIASLYDPDGPNAEPHKTPLRTMPLCKFPEMAHYAGQGDLNDAGNWSCPTDDKSLVRVGKSGALAGVVP